MITGWIWRCRLGFEKSILILVELPVEKAFQLSIHTDSLLHATNIQSVMLDVCIQKINGV